MTGERKKDVCGWMYELGQRAQVKRMPRYEIDDLCSGPSPTIWCLEHSLWSRGPLVFPHHLTTPLDSIVNNDSRIRFQTQDPLLNLPMNLCEKHIASVPPSV